MPEPQKKAWFAHKRYGYGAGLPIRWQGWAVLALYALFIYLAVTFLAALFKFIVIIGASLVLIALCARRTEGGWRWRWGGKP